MRNTSNICAATAAQSLQTSEESIITLIETAVFLNMKLCHVSHSSPWVEQGVNNMELYLQFVAYIMCSDVSVKSKLALTAEHRPTQQVSSSPLQPCGNLVSSCVCVCVCVRSPSGQMCQTCFQSISCLKS